MMKHVATVFALTLFLAACGGGGGGGGGGSGIDPRLARLDIYEAQKLRVLGDPGAGVQGMPITEEANVPVSGMMSFEGSGTMRVEVGVTPLILFGDARLDVNFDTGNTAGAIENSFGTNATGDIVDYSGTIALESLQTSQDMPLSYAGTLSAGNLSLGFSGSMNGTFLGNPTTAFSAADLEADVNQSGVMRTGTIVITLEETVAPEGMAN